MAKVRSLFTNTAFMHGYNDSWEKSAFMHGDITTEQVQWETCVVGVSKKNRSGYLSHKIKEQKKRVDEEVTARKMGLGVRLLRASKEDLSAAKCVKFSSKFNKNKDDKRTLIKLNPTKNDESYSKSDSCVCSDDSSVVSPNDVDPQTPDSRSYIKIKKKEKEAEMKKYLESLERSSKLESKIINSQEDSRELADHASKAEAKSQELKDAFKD
nr:CWC16 protein [Tanacetum cinerariifolium]